MSPLLGAVHTDAVEFAKIVLLSVVAAVGYGIVHDQVTARVCIEYFTVFHPPVFHTNNPTLLGLGWGIIATWWMGAFLGVLLAIAARAGGGPKFTARMLGRPVLKLLGMMLVSAAIFGCAGYILASRGAIAPPNLVSEMLAPASYPAFMADWWAHITSYAVGGVGGLILCVLIFLRRATIVGTK